MLSFVEICSGRVDPGLSSISPIQRLVVGRGVLDNALAASCSISRSLERILSSRRVERLASISRGFPSISWTAENGFDGRGCFSGLVVDSLSRFSFLCPMDSDSDPFRFSGENTSRTSEAEFAELLDSVCGISTVGFPEGFVACTIEV